MFLLAYIVTTSKALATSCDALVPSSEKSVQITFRFSGGTEVCWETMLQYSEQRRLIKLRPLCSNRGVSNRGTSKRHIFADCDADSAQPCHRGSLVEVCEIAHRNVYKKIHHTDATLLIR